jgi:hypothetical protein
MSDDLFSGIDAAKRERLRQLGYIEETLLMGRYWRTPDGSGKITEEEAFRLLEKEGGGKDG